MCLRGGRGGGEQEESSYPFDGGNAADDEQDQSGQFGGISDPAESPIESAQPTPGNQCRTNECQEKSSNIGASGLLPATFREIGETGRHSAAWTGDAEQGANRARGKAERLVGSEPARVRLQSIGNSKAPEHRQTQCDQQEASPPINRESMRLRIVDHGMGTGGESCLILILTIGRKGSS